MEQITNAQEDNLQAFFDGKLEGPALQQLKADLAASPAMQKRLEKLRLIHQALATSTLQSPSPSFVKRVMANLHTYSGTAPSPRNGMLLVLGVMIATGMLVAIVSAGVFDQVGGMITIDQVAPVKKYFQQSIPSIPVSGKLLINILVGLNLALAFIVLDRTVLRPYFQRRANQWS